MITHIEHPAITNGIDTHDIAYESAAGELGFWIDSTVTRIVQTGVEHTRIPDIGPSTPGQSPCTKELVIMYLLNYLDNRDPRSLLATISKQHSTLLSVGSPFDQLRSVLSATFADFAVDYNLDLSVLLQGARGTGKSTVACWVAQRLGFNILEVSFAAPSFQMIPEFDADKLLQSPWGERHEDRGRTAHPLRQSHSMCPMHTLPKTR